MFGSGTCAVMPAAPRSPLQKLGRFRPGIGKYLRQYSSAEIFALVVWNGCRTPVGVSKEFVAALLAGLLKPKALEEANDLASASRVKPAQTATSTCSSATNLIRGASFPSRQSAMTSRMRGANSSRVRACV